MELYLSKLIPFWLYPLGLAIQLLCFVALGSLVLARWKTGLVVLLVAAGLWTTSTMRFAGWVAGTLERDYPEQLAESYANADAIVVLGGALNPAYPPRRYADLDQAVDRVQHALRLFRADRAPLIVIAGGLLPWAGAQRSEAQEIAELLVAWGVPRERLVLEGSSRNTRENAVLTAALLEERALKRVLLVTSASHMRRALAAFRLAGVDALPAATDLQRVDGGEPTLLDWMPDARALELTTRALKEHLGWAYYRWKGWV